ncbi:translation initiation factor 1 (eIF-1/SUI1) [Maridesulfovibrio ferrireducens]|uniref:Translation initiation factor 1 (eIF-1/SUI1) n=1 Tax=Maridesulfovibrio ferrireducens TaxID=246191 RepID=A0A1G9B7D7_9BACT|nr:translation initiation factor Sui1 [Maridesulfovibrio ferrireducens]SDK35413.1 translation initiation factor 1 (eIF-1/SUI1) [Maridesulfovibrio ferrireducens]
MAQNKKQSTIVYSTDHGTICPACNRPKANCTCGQKSIPKSDGIVRIERQTKGRKGKGVSLITGLPLEGNDLKKLAKTLKAKCGTGGTLKDGIIEIQGDHRQALKLELEKLGYKVKLAGG